MSRDVNGLVRTLEVYAYQKLNPAAGEVENIVGQAMLDAAEIIRDLKKRLDNLVENG